MIKGKNRNTAIVFGVIFICMFFITAVCPYLSDDWRFKYIWYDFEPHKVNYKVKSLSDIILSMKNYYNLSGGRVICHFLVFVCDNLPKIVFNILNALIYCVLGAQVYKSYRLIAKKEYDSKILLAIFMVIPFALPAFGDAAIWLSGSVNYMWPTALLLICINWIMEKYDDASVFDVIKCTLLVLICSMTNEITGGMIFLALLCRLIVMENRKIRHIVPFVAVLIGTPLVLMAPGNVNRRINCEEQSGFSILTIIKTSFSYVSYLTYFKYIIITIMIVTGIVCIIINKEDIKKAFIDGIYLIIGIAGMVALGGSQVFIERPLFQCYIFVFIYFLYTISYVKDKLVEYLKREDVDGVKQLIGCLTKSILICMMISVVLNIFSLIYMVVIVLLLVFVLVEVLFINKIMNKKVVIFLNGMYARKTVEKCLYIALIAFFSISLFNYVKWSDKQNKYQNKVIELTKKEKFLEASKLKNNSKQEKSFLVPEVAHVVGREYLVQWIGTNAGGDYYNSDLKKDILNRK